jgi:hypothetical protein
MVDGGVIGSSSFHVENDLIEQYHYKVASKNVLRSSAEGPAVVQQIYLIEGVNRTALL